MKRAQSAYLDLLRLAAALAVFLSHLSWAKLTGGFLWRLQEIGHPAVIVFFVLSGFVIQYATATKETTFYEYSVARFARLYSVVLPALLLTYVCDKIGMLHNPTAYYLNDETNPVLRLVAAGLFLSQVWTWDLRLLSDDAFWSLPYEFWYYQMFAAAVFFAGRTRILLFAIAAMISGPVILLLFPIWVLGVFAYRLSVAHRLERNTALVLWLASMVGVAVSFVMREESFFKIYNVSYLPSSFSLSDYFMGFFVALNIFSASYLDLPLKGLAKHIAASASITFSLYLFHLPLLFLFAAYTPSHWSVTERGIGAAAFTLTAVILLAQVTEARKSAWRKFFRWLFSCLGGLAVT